MKKVFVYKIVNLNGDVEYIGETVNPKRRYYEHVRAKGKFAWRKDIKLVLIKEFNNKHDAYNYQCDLQIQYGFKTDKEIHLSNRKISNSEARELAINAIKLKRSIPILMLDYYTGNLIKEYKSTNDAAKELGINSGSICMALKSKSKKYKQYKFLYK